MPDIPWKVGEYYRDIMERDYKLLYIVPETENVSKPLVFNKLPNEGIVSRYLNGRAHDDSEYSFDIIPPEPEVEVSEELLRTYVRAAYPDISNEWTTRDLPSTVRGIKAVISQYLKETKEK